MKIGCVKELKNNEYRVGLTPSTVSEYVAAGHAVTVQAGAGAGSFIDDGEYAAAGAKIVRDAAPIWAENDMIIKVKEPLPVEYPLMREGQIIYTYFHFAADRELTEACLDRKIIAMAYETMEDENRALPLLKPMSEVAGNMAVLVGSYFLMRPNNGRGVLPSGVPGVLPAEVAVVGGGIVGRCAARMAAGLGARVTILDNSLKVLTELKNIMPANVFTRYSDSSSVAETLGTADISVGAVLVPGAKTPKVVTREHVKNMKKGSVIVDVAIDQGGCFETSRPTTHSDPVFVDEGVIHYCVSNMPGAYARTSTIALNNATLRYGLQIANKGAEAAAKSDHTILTGMNTYKGVITFKAVAEAFDKMDKYADPLSCI